MDEIARDPDGAKKLEGIDAAFYVRYRNRKAAAKKHFDEHGGKYDAARARENPPEDMSKENWWKAIDFFMSDKHVARSEVNKRVRQQQKYANRGGTSSYSSFCHKREKRRLEAFYNAHTRKDATFDNYLAEHQYNQLKAIFDSQMEHIGEDEFEENSEHPNEVEVFHSLVFFDKCSFWKLVL